MRAFYKVSIEIERSYASFDQNKNYNSYKFNLNELTQIYKKKQPKYWIEKFCLSRLDWADFRNLKQTMLTKWSKIF